MTGRLVGADNVSVQHPRDDGGSVRNNGVSAAGKVTHTHPPAHLYVRPTRNEGRRHNSRATPTGHRSSGGALPEYSGRTRCRSSVNFTTVISVNGVISLILPGRSDLGDRRTTGADPGE